LDPNDPTATVCVAPPTNLVAWYSGDNHADDLQGANNGTLVNGAGFATGMVGQAFSLNGVDGYVEVPDSASLDLTSQVTLMAWVNPATISGSFSNRIIDKSEAGVGGAYDLDIRQGKLRLLTVAGTGAFLSNSSIQTGVWTHVAGVYTGSEVQLYINGVLDNSGSFSGAISTNNLPLRIGAASNASANNMFHGFIDEATVVGTALPSEEIQSIYLAGSFGKCKPDLIGPQAYLQTSDSPFFADIQASTVVLEDFEDGMFNVPGVSFDHSPINIIGPSSSTDSVDGDDGLVDGNGSGGKSLFPCTGPYNFTFSPPYPTKAGIVWTDGADPVSFQAYDASNTLIGTITGNHADANETGETAEDRFYGVTHASGISRISIDNQNACIELDHLQFGAPP
ncbi:MAG: LamG domain-containing protein, partial [Nevskiales bacterium]